MVDDDWRSEAEQAQGPVHAQKLAQPHKLKIYGQNLKLEQFEPKNWKTSQSKS